ncbi:MAG: polyphosphate polymerase domain-containing protein [Lachnoclostridium sp.]|nr:polyphosphate polymerase domain-containing protein [Lachnoclostridium sp.]
MKEIQYRHEYKYPLTRGQILIEDAKIRAIAMKDEHVGARGCYNIRSLYFDDYDDSCYMDNVNGVDRREKYRIRIYNHSKDVIHLEMKQKIWGKTHKEACKISLSQCEQLMSSQIPSDIEPEQRVLHKLTYLMAVKLMRPAVIVDYDRVPYVYTTEDANVRITFDSNITSISNTDMFFDKQAVGREVLSVGQALMEVKFDSFLPDEIYSLLQLNGLNASTFSKYYLCRRFRA